MRCKLTADKNKVEMTRRASTAKKRWIPVRGCSMPDKVPNNTGQFYSCAVVQKKIMPAKVGWMDVWVVVSAKERGAAIIRNQYGNEIIGSLCWLHDGRSTY
ncbi:hypothetical protein CBL_03189 [Carabus blaptoides fortunei]